MNERRNHTSAQTDTIKIESEKSGEEIKKRKIHPLGLLDYLNQLISLYTLGTSPLGRLSV